MNTVDSVNSFCRLLILSMLFIARESNIGTHIHLLTYSLFFAHTHITLRKVTKIYLLDHKSFFQSMERFIAQR